MIQTAVAISAELRTLQRSSPNWLHDRQQEGTLSQPGTPAAQGLPLLLSTVAPLPTGPCLLSRSSCTMLHPLQSSPCNAEERELARDRRPGHLKLKTLGQFSTSLCLSLLTFKMGGNSIVIWGNILQLKCVNKEQTEK